MLPATYDSSDVSIADNVSTAHNVVGGNGIKSSNLSSYSLSNSSHLVALLKAENDRKTKSNDSMI